VNGNDLEKRRRWVDSELPGDSEERMGGCGADGFSEERRD
jgi:hypothetical protein